MPFHCTICGEESTLICVRCTKDTCQNHLCDKCHRCSDCCDCEVALEEHTPAHGLRAESPGGTHAHEVYASNRQVEAAAAQAAKEQDSELVRLLEEGGREITAVVSGVSEELAKMSPGAGQWSILDCMEHVAITEERGRMRLETAPMMGAPGVDKEKEAGLAAQVLDRSARFQAPAAILPAGRFSSLAEALEAFQAQRALTIDFVREQSDGLYPRLLKHPLFGDLNGVEMVILIAGHARRHAAQMRAARAAVEEQAPAADLGI